MAERKTITSSNAPSAIGPYSQAMLVGNTLYISGQLGIDPATGKMAGEGVTEQTHQALKNVQAILKEGRMTLGDVVQCQVLLADMGDFADMNAVYGEYFGENPPTRAAFGVSALPAGGRVEVLATAVRR